MLVQLSDPHVVAPGRRLLGRIDTAGLLAQAVAAVAALQPAAAAVVVTGDRPTIQVPAIDYNVRCLIITGGYTPSSDVQERAAERGVTILISPHDTATTTLLVRSAKIIARAVTRVTFWGALAMALTAGIGALFGTAV